MGLIIKHQCSDPLTLENYAQCIQVEFGKKKKISLHKRNLPVYATTLTDM